MIRTQLFAEQFVERMDQTALAIQVKAQALESQLLEGDIRAGKRVPPGRLPRRPGPSAAAQAGPAFSTAHRRP